MNSAESVLRQIIATRLAAWSTGDLLEMLCAIRVSPDIYRPHGRTITLHTELARAELGRRRVPLLASVPAIFGTAHDLQGREEWRA